MMKKLLIPVLILLINVCYGQNHLSVKLGGGSGGSTDTSSLSNRINLKAPLASPTFTGTPKISTDTVATKAYARSVGGGTGEVTLAVGSPGTELEFAL